MQGSKDGSIFGEAVNAASARFPGDRATTTMVVDSVIGVVLIARWAQERAF